jgi:hypothetical protein
MHPNMTPPFSVNMGDGYFVREQIFGAENWDTICVKDWPMAIEKAVLDGLAAYLYSMTI